MNSLAADTDFRTLVDAYVANYRQAMAAPTWFNQAYPRSPLTVAYFSMEYGLGEALPIFSGDLGILAGDYLKTASDMGVPATSGALHAAPDPVPRRSRGASRGRIHNVVRAIGDGTAHRVSVSNSPESSVLAFVSSPSEECATRP